MQTVNSAVKTNIKGGKSIPTVPECESIHSEKCPVETALDKHIFGHITNLLILKLSSTVWSNKGFPGLYSKKRQLSYPHSDSPSFHKHVYRMSLAVCTLNVKQGIPQIIFKFWDNYYIEF